MFGGEHGISFMKDFPAIGFMYRDSSTSGHRGRKMNIGYSSMISMNYDDPLTPSGFAYHHSRMEPGLHSFRHQMFAMFV
jgi:hypothetical protein